MTAKEWASRHLLKRKLIRNQETKISFVQIIGFILMAIGIIFMLIIMFSKGEDTSEDGGQVAVSFFIIMLGVSFAFPSLLKDQNKGLSTMRIVVFMLSNVICILLLKIGWGAENLSEIGLDQYWMGIIAFILGAKATQAYFESKMAVPKESKEKVGVAGLSYSKADVAKLALDQNTNILMQKFPNIISISDAVDDMSHENTHVIAIYLEDTNSAGIPEVLEVKMPDGSLRTIPTEIIEDVGEGTIQCSHTDNYITDSISGSVCCKAKTLNNQKVLLTSGHIYSKLRLINEGGWLDNDQMKPVKLNTQTIGKWIFQQINYVQDIGFIEIDNTVPTDDIMSFSETGMYDITDISIKKEEVTLISGKSGKRDGFLLDHNTTWGVWYKNDKQYKGNIILVGSEPNRKNSKTLSQRGDSGGLVFHKNSKRLIGMILGGNKKFTWVLPVKDTLNYFELTLL